MPTQTSTNRYVPYRKSEYEEMDINDIYPYKSPKYKTLIEVVLKPSKSTHDAENIHIDNNIVHTTYIPSGTYSDKPIDKPINKLTDEEWNELKKDFISNMLQNDNMDLPNENIIDDNIYKNIQPNIVDSGNPLEKPFITSIQDRFLDNHEKINYDIDWNVPENITTNNVDIPKYITSNDKYSGIDLINHSLNSGNDIYDELLKRKENELFGTKHPKHTSTNRVVKQIYDNPILNQLDLFDKWLDRHRSNHWKNKPDMSNEEWNRQHDDNIPVENDNNTTHKMFNTNLYAAISSDMTLRSNMDISGTNLIYSDTNRYTYFDDISIDEVSPFNNRDKLLNTNLYVEISSDMTPRSNMDMSGTNTIYSDTNRYTYFDDISINEVSPFNNRDKLLNTNLSIEISSDMTPRSNMDISGTNTIYSDTNRYTYFDDISINEVSPFNNRDKLLNTNFYVEISSDMTPRSNMDISGTNLIYSDTNRYTYLDDMELLENSSDENL
ncbi:erythrocyte membrane protein 1, PfEMP1, putative [Plasmodium sp. DRC-Itaito]|nr:erythrocyte membrane protein 1, PfEMP1, putative [Plasmodium sp. DRC-Itaito]